MFPTFRLLLIAARYHGGTAKLRAAYLAGGMDALFPLLDQARAAPAGAGVCYKVPRGPVIRAERAPELFKNGYWYIPGRRWMKGRARWSTNALQYCCIARDRSPVDPQRVRVASPERKAAAHA